MEAGSPLQVGAAGRPIVFIRVRLHAGVGSGRFSLRSGGVWVAFGVAFGLRAWRMLKIRYAVLRLIDGVFAGCWGCF